jgi:hypothetical protein
LIFSFVTFLFDQERISESLLRRRLGQAARKVEVRKVKTIGEAYRFIFLGQQGKITISLEIKLKLICERPLHRSFYLSLQSKK